MKYIIAVSGGVDSVVLLDMLARDVALAIDAPPLSSTKSIRDRYVVAHFDHGIRPNSADDANFVRDLANEYNLEFIYKRIELGEGASEEVARRKRYEFLRQVKNRVGDNSRIITAHHVDDLLETVAMNLIRGTGWRGLAPFWSDDIIRPLINHTKADIVRYAIENDLKWVEDDTNYSPKYFRNRVRDRLNRTPNAALQQLVALHHEQRQLRQEIEGLIQELPLSENTLDTKLFSNLTNSVSIEILRIWTGAKLTTPQLSRLLQFIKAAKSGDICQPGGGIQIRSYRGKISLTNLERTREYDT